MEKIRYNKELLDTIIKRDNSTLLGTYDKVTKRTIINYICHCGEEYKKECYDIIKRSGAFCKKCITKRFTEKIHKKHKVICNTEELHKIIQRDNAILLEKYGVIIKSNSIKFKCQCGEEGTKNCLQLIKVSGAFCKKCTRLKRIQKQKETNIERYGVECTLHAPLIKDYIRQHNLDKYGVENIFSSLEIQEQIKNTILERYGVEHISQSDEFKQKTKETNLERYGIENPNKTKEVRDKIKKTCLERYGVEHISQTKQFKDTCKKTCLERYGVEHVSSTQEFKDKVKQIFIKKYGVDNPNKTKEVRDKIKKTCLERYGVEYPSQCIEISEKTQKNAKKYKEYKMPSGDIRKVQGYEPFALDILIKKYKEDDIKTDRKDIPRITYTINKINKYYFPDIYIPSENKIIEVKSTWTYNCKLDNIQEKMNATKENYDYDIWIFDSNGIHQKN